MSRIVLVSNRVADLNKAGQAGGVVIAIADVLSKRHGLWLGWNGKIGEKSEEQRTKPDIAEVGGATVATLPLSSREYKDYYLGYANDVLWPVFHSRLDVAQFEAGYYQRYLEVNRRFARALHPLLKPDDTIWVHDYHMIPLGLELRKLGVENSIGFFLHIPVPPAQMFLAIPEHRELARGLAAYDLVGVQTRVDVANLIDFLQDGVFGRMLQDGRIRVFDREMSIAAFPVGIDVDSFVGSRPKVLREPARTVTRLIGVDRLDYTKGLPQKFRAFGRFLEKNPDYRRKVILSQLAPPTRESVLAYVDIRHELETLSGTINGKFGELDWVPIHYIHRATPRKMLVDVFGRLADRRGDAVARRHEPRRQGIRRSARPRGPGRPYAVALRRRSRADEGGAHRQSLRRGGDGRHYQDRARDGRAGTPRAPSRAARRHPHA